MIYILAKLATPTRTLRRNLVYVTGNTGEDDLHLATLYHFYVAYIFYKDAKTNLVYVAGNNGLDDLHTCKVGKPLPVLCWRTPRPT